MDKRLIVKSFLLIVICLPANNNFAIGQNINRTDDKLMKPKAIAHEIARQISSKGGIRIFDFNQVVKNHGFAVTTAGVPINFGMVVFGTRCDHKNRIPGGVVVIAKDAQGVILKLRLCVDVIQPRTKEPATVDPLDLALALKTIRLSLEDEKESRFMVSGVQIERGESIGFRAFVDIDNQPCRLGAEKTKVSDKSKVPRTDSENGQNKGDKTKVSGQNKGVRDLKRK
jgi:hypothetical protein